MKNRLDMSQPHYIQYRVLFIPLVLSLPRHGQCSQLKRSTVTRKFSMNLRSLTAGRQRKPDT